MEYTSHKPSEPQELNMKRRWSIRGAVVASLLVTAVAAAIAEEVVVQVQSVTIRKGKGSMYGVAGEATYQQKLTVLERQADGWLKVQIAGAEGFVRESALVARRTSSGVGKASGAAMAASGEPSDTGAAAAARGLKPLSVELAGANGQSTAALEQLIQNRSRVVGEPWIQFCQQGQVGPSRQGAK